jgi:hypothetical protein
VIRLRVDRSPGLQFLVGLVGLLLVVAAIDIMWGHWLSTAPQRVGDAISSLGRAQQRADYVWGTVFLAGGGVLFGTSLAALVRRRPALLVLEEGLELYIAGRDRSHFVPWEQIGSVRSGRDHDEHASRDRDVLIVDIAEPTDLPADPWGAEWVGTELHIDADHWTPGVTEVVVYARLAMDEHRRDRSQ